MKKTVISFLIFALSITLVFLLTACAEKEDTQPTPVPECNHAYVKETIAPTCTENGFDKFSCTKCDRYYSIQINATGHSPNAAVEENRTEATCTAEGHYDSVVYCGKCDDELSRETVNIPTLIHNHVNNICTGCGEVMSSEGLEYTLNPDGKSYTVTGIGSFTGKELFIGMYNGLPVTSIGNEAFYGCTSLTSVTIGNSVTSIGSSAFYYCFGLTSITIPDSVTSIGWYAFSYCESLTSVTMGNGVTSIDHYAFIKSGLTSITIPNSVTSIGYSAFSYCSDLTSITVDASNPNYKSIDGNLYTKDGKTLIQYAIGKSETSFTIPDSVTSIGNDAFCGCSGLTSVTIGNGVTSIGSEAFRVCSGLTSITIPDSVTSIGDDAFYGCSGLTSVTIGNGVTSIGSSAFLDCSSLTSITVDASNPSYKSIDGNLYTKDGKTLIQYAIGKSETSFTIPDGVTSIGHGAFENCDSLTSITIPDSVTSIGSLAFFRCYDLTSVTIGNGVTSIGDWAFYACRSLTNVTIGNSVTSIGELAFYYCYNLTSITIPDSVTSIGEDAFSWCSSLTSIKYRGTEEQWNAITKGSNWDYDTRNCTITYNYTGA